MDVILSTRNQSKIDQITALLSGRGINVLSLEDAGIKGEVVEDGITLEENAYKKAKFASNQSGMWAIADDTGLYIEALDGQPGIHAARWAGDCSTEEIMGFTLDKLKGVPLENRTAVFQTVAVVVSPDGKKFSFGGSVSGILLPEPRTLCQPNMPYSAIFLPKGSAKVWAEMTVEEENSLSHRGIAFRQVREFLHRLQ